MTRYEIDGAKRPGRGPGARRTRRPVTPGVFFGATLVVLLLGLAAGAVVVRLATPPGASAAQAPTADHLYLTIAYNPYNGLDEYFPANFTVPVNVSVVITITNYDNGTNVIPEAYTNVTGTVGGTETVTNATLTGAAVSHVPADRVAHTFTLIAGPYDVNAPIPSAQGLTPTVVTFTVVFTQAGQFTWRCMAPCDPSAMGTPGFMTGTVTVGG